jgi:ribose transport system permease protein
VNVHATRIAAYSLGGAFAAFGGVALTALVQSSQATSSNFYILAGLTAVALGGNSLAGGRGGLLCTFFGALTLYLLQTFLSAAGVPPTWLNVVYGLMLVIGVTVGARATMFRPNPDRAPKAAAGASA